MEPAPRHAGFWRRFGAALADVVVVWLGITALGRLGLPIYSRAEHGASVEGLSASAGFAVEYNGFGTVLGVAVAWLYFALQESSRRQATLGKLLLGIRVTDLAGARIGFGRATGRHFAKYLSGVILMIGFVMAGLTRRKQALHDIIAGTLVVERPAAR
jgi:uncharacterized RDD family membrane protein YckC